MSTSDHDSVSSRSGSSVSNTSKLLRKYTTESSVFLPSDFIDGKLTYNVIHTWFSRLYNLPCKTKLHERWHGLPWIETLIWIASSTERVTALDSCFYIRYSKLEMEKKDEKALDLTLAQIFVRLEEIAKDLLKKPLKHAIQYKDVIKWSFFPTKDKDRLPTANFRIYDLIAGLSAGLILKLHGQSKEFQKSVGALSGDFAVAKLQHLLPNIALFYQHSKGRQNAVIQQMLGLFEKSQLLLKRDEPDHYLWFTNSCFETPTVAASEEDRQQPLAISVHMDTEMSVINPVCLLGEELTINKHQLNVVNADVERAWQAEKEAAENWARARAKSALLEQNRLARSVATLMHEQNHGVLTFIRDKHQQYFTVQPDIQKFVEEIFELGLEAKYPNFAQPPFDKTAYCKITALHQALRYTTNGKTHEMGEDFILKLGYGGNFDTLLANLVEQPERENNERSDEGASCDRINKGGSHGSNKVGSHGSNKGGSHGSNKAGPHGRNKAGSHGSNKAGSHGSNDNGSDTSIEDGSQGGNGGCSPGGNGGGLLGGNGGGSPEGNGGVSLGGNGAGSPGGNGGGLSGESEGGSHGKNDGGTCGENESGSHRSKEDNKCTELKASYSGGIQGRTNDGIKNFVKSSTDKLVFHNNDIEQQRYSSQQQPNCDSIENHTSHIHNDAYEPGDATTNKHGVSQAPDKNTKRKRVGIQQAVEPVAKKMFRRTTRSTNSI